PLEGQRSAGKVTEKRTIEGENGESLTASPYASEETPNYYPGGTVAGRPVPAGWYSRPWWADAMATGVWMMGYSMMFNAMFMGMRSEEHTSELQSRFDLVCRLLLEKKNYTNCRSDCE